MAPRGGTFRSKGACVCASAFFLTLCASGLRARDPSATPTESTPSSSLRIRKVRVLIVSEAARVRLRSGDTLVVLDESGGVQGRFDPDTAVVITRRGGKSLRVGGSLRVSSGATIRSLDGAPIRVSRREGDEWSPELSYDGWMRLKVAEGRRLDVINHVDVESYVACVVANEVWPTFHEEAYRAQAIVSRSFVLYQMDRRPATGIDVTATQGSQVYRGIRTDGPGRRAAEATEYTRGLVLTHRGDTGRDQLFCTYYSAACGGMSQSAALLGAEGDVEPLHGGVACDYCRIAPGDNYRWGPETLSADDALRRLAARYPSITSLGRIRRIEPIERTPAGRPVILRIYGTGDTSHDILAERFRVAIGAMVAKSTDCRITVGNGEVVFDEGKGFGHGLGLCQWGTQGQAIEGKRAGEILAFYYPGSRLLRAY